MCVHIRTILPSKILVYVIYYNYRKNYASKIYFNLWCVDY